MDGLNSFISVEPYSRPFDPSTGTTGTTSGGNKATKGLCYDFNKKDGCARQDCKFNHACSYKDKSKGNDWVCMDPGHNFINHK